MEYAFVFVHIQAEEGWSDKTTIPIRRRDPKRSEISGQQPDPHSTRKVRIRSRELSILDPPPPISMAHAKKM